jgi:purine-binding chemotaxis protein CheW
MEIDSGFNSGVDAEELEDTLSGKHLTFTLGKEEFGLEIRYVTEIIGVQDITDLPDTPDYLRGVINLRGKVIPVIDMRIRFHLEPKEYDERTCIIHVNMRDTSVGLIVDTVSEVIEISEDMIENPPKVNSGVSNHYISGLGRVNDEVKILLNIEKLLFDEEMDVISDIADE